MGGLVLGSVARSAGGGVNSRVTFLLVGNLWFGPCDGVVMGWFIWLFAAWCAFSVAAAAVFARVITVRERREAPLLFDEVQSAFERADTPSSTVARTTAEPAAQ
ncbi:hypothetical protein [Rhodococcus sp. CH91]|uniref:hypothetical protein n=1 Tax=Rhodococcus sp. CH91 TaxID=2910256 RepID=UPI001F4B383E|nr:hypothetical protein [Rhodococcus sp. CH91]